VEWVIDELRHGKAVTGFTDYHTSSIDADSLAGILMELCRIRPSGVWNIAGGEVTSKYQFITALAFRLGFDAVLVSRGLLSDLQMSAVRAESLGLEVGRAEKMLGRPLPSFSKVIDNLALEYESLKNV
jgi:dTDP-4-dehydrorhamnose reductase